MSSQEQRVRMAVLAQALESADPKIRLVDLAQRERATQAALQASRALAGASRTTAEDLVYLRAEALVKAAVVAHPGLALLERPRPWWSWLAAGVPLVALLLGVLTDQVGNPHRVDLLSLPLLGVIGWNLLMYALLAAALLWHPRPGHGRASFFASVRHWVNSWPVSWPVSGPVPLRSSRGASLAGAAAAFYSQWHSLTEKLTLYRGKKVLHLSAAAWGAGVALSLVARGLVVQYQVGWESTFLQAQHVHAMLQALFWPLKLFFPIAPFSVDEVAALRNFAVPGHGGERWVYLYAGLLGLIVVLPRLVLAGWSAWRAYRIASAIRIDLEHPYYRELVVRLQTTCLVIGLVTDDTRTAAQLQRLLRLGADNPQATDLAISSAEGDQLSWVEKPGRQPVDVVLQISADLHMTPVPHGWDAQPMAAPDLDLLAGSWLQPPVLLKALARSLPAAALLGLTRLEREWAKRDSLRFQQSMLKVAGYLLDMNLRFNASMSPETLAQARDRLFLQLLELHRLDRTEGRALEEKLAQRYLAGSGSSGASAIAKPKASAAGAAAGATMGGAIDLATAGLTLGAAAALGGALGAGVGWAFAAWKKKGQGGDIMLALTEAALLLYLEVANFSRLQAGEGDDRAGWQTAISSTVRSQKKALELIWSAGRPAGRAGEAGANTGSAAAELSGLLSMMAQSLLDALYPPAQGPGSRL
jgi:Protein of unknown function (DUF2868)